MLLQGYWCIYRGVNISSQPTQAENEVHCTSLFRSSRMSNLMLSALLVASSISALSSSMCSLYSSKAAQISSLKSSISTKSGKNGRISSIFKRSEVWERKASALFIDGQISESAQLEEMTPGAYCLISRCSSTTCLAIFNHSFFRNASSSSGLFAFI